MKDCSSDPAGKGIGFFERYLTVWVIACIVVGITLGKLAPGVAKSLDAMASFPSKAPPGMPMTPLLSKESRWPWTAPTPN